MAIHRLLKNCPLEPKEISHVIAAYEQALYTLCVKDRDDPLTEMIAKKIIKIAQSGFHDPAQISAQAIKELEIQSRLNRVATDVALTDEERTFRDTVIEFNQCGGVTMDWNRVEGNWKQVKGKVKEQWGKLTDDDLDVIAGKQDQLEGRLQQRYGYAKDQAKKEVNDWYDSQTWQ
jgi:uncharacterized protein YjbJ (UPF0337 family)